MGHNVIIEGETLVELFENLMQSCIIDERHGIVNKDYPMLQLSSMTVLVKNPDKTWTSIGDNGIDQAVARAYHGEPKTKLCLTARWV